MFRSLSLVRRKEYIDETNIKQKFKWKDVNPNYCLQNPKLYIQKSLNVNQLMALRTEKFKCKSLNDISVKECIYNLHT